MFFSAKEKPMNIGSALKCCHCKNVEPDPPDSYDKFGGEIIRK